MDAALPTPTQEQKCKKKEVKEREGGWLRTEDENSLCNEKQNYFQHLPQRKASPEQSCCFLVCYFQTQGTEPRGLCMPSKYFTPNQNIHLFFFFCGKWACHVAQVGLEISLWPR